MNATVLRYVLPLPMLLVLTAQGPDLFAGEHEHTPDITTPPQTLAVSPYIQRGNQVEAHYHAYTARFGKFHEALRALLAQEAPDLAKKLKSEPPQPVTHGYQIVPRLVPDKPRPKKSRRVISTSYSWPRTMRMIEKQVAKMRTLLDDRLDAVSGMPRTERMPVYEKLVSDYGVLAKKHKQVFRHIQHNKLWQGVIHRGRAGFDRRTKLYHAVLERQAILDALSARDELSFAAAIASVHGIEETRPRSEVEGELRRRERELSRRIRAASKPPYRREFVRIEHLGVGRWRIHVPIYTDIEDEALLQRFKEAVEGHWHVSDGDEEFRVIVSLRRLPTDELYRRSARCAPGSGDVCQVPQRGDPIDLAEHVALFPGDGGALTTGSKTIYVKGAGCIVLSPLDVAPRTLAHEFGHVLGFRDEYVRGYRDLGADGYEILEIVPRPDDIMASPGFGRVQRFHFEAILGGPRRSQGVSGEPVDRQSPVRAGWR